MKTIKLCKGPGKIGESHCVMSAISILNGEKFSDKPSCVCRLVRPLVIAMNDMISDDNFRNAHLTPLVWSLIGTATDDETVYSLRKRTLAKEAKLLSDRQKVKGISQTMPYHGDLAMSVGFWTEFIWHSALMNVMETNCYNKAELQRRMMLHAGFEEMHTNIDITCNGLIALVNKVVAIGDQRPKEPVAMYLDHPDKEKLHYVND